MPGDRIRELARELGYRPVVTPTSYRNPSWPYDRDLYRRNEVERFFCRLKRFRRTQPATTSWTSSSPASSTSR